MTTDQLQGVSCVILGGLTALGAYAYRAPLVASITDLSTTWLLFPVIAGGYAIGCSVGATTGPGTYWIYQRFFAER